MPRVHINTENAIKELRKAHSEISNPKFDRAVVQALNHTISKTKTEASKQIKIIYGARSKDIKKGLRIERATRYDKSATLIGFGFKLPLIAFGARQNKKGVSVKIKGKKHLVNKAFIATMKSGHRGVFARGQYEQGKFKFRRKRLRRRGNDLHINELSSVSVPGALSNDIIINTLTSKMQTDFPQRLSHLLSR